MRAYTTVCLCFGDEPYADVSVSAHQAYQFFFNSFFIRKRQASTEQLTSCPATDSAKTKSDILEKIDATLLEAELHRL